ncbi:MAG: dTDP-glucose 4,6-dehydratase [Candidatus Omnitrophica bacterium]|nr:dTDP-glucose 4,6-dehydratase [Candidatus Omnitrophota bacterium]
MRKKIHKILVTGGAGFIGSAFVRLLLKGGADVNENLPELAVVDKLTYAGDLARLQGVEGKYKFYKTDICDKKSIGAIFNKEKPDILVNFAAETHVDRSINDASAFIETNIRGVHILLEASRRYKIKRFYQISTDEVYGDIMQGGFNEASPLKPNSPYAASKAAADLLIKSYIRTYNFPAVILRPCNNYGPWQYPEKLISVIINNAINSRRVPVYAKGWNVREWIYVTDCVEAIFLLLNKAKAGEIYNIGSGHHEKNIDVVKQALRILKKPFGLIEFVKDRPGHDFRYSLDSSKIKKLGWRPKVDFLSGLQNTVAWSIANYGWLLDKEK